MVAEESDLAVLATRLCLAGMLGGVLSVTDALDAWI